MQREQQQDKQQPSAIGAETGAAKAASSFPEFTASPEAPPEMGGSPEPHSTGSAPDAVAQNSFELSTAGAAFSEAAPLLSTWYLQKSMI